MSAAGLIALMLFAGSDVGAAGAGVAPGEEAAAPAPYPPAPVQTTPVPAAPPAAPPPIEPQPQPLPRRYADRGTMEIGAGFGYSSLEGFLAAGAFRYFVVDGVAPGVEATYVSGGSGGLSYGLALAALRVVPVRTGSFALLLTARAGRMFVGDHDDGWAAGGGAGILILVAPTAGIELGYEALRLFPASFCADLTSCVLQGPVVGFRFGL